MAPTAAPLSPATTRSPGFPAVGGGSRLHPRPSPGKRAGLAGFGLVNRLLPKSASSVVLHSTIDLEDGVLAVVEELARRGWGATILLEDASRAGRLRALVGDTARLVPKRSAEGIRQFLGARYVMTTENVYGNEEPPSSQIVVNLWHGEPPTKAVGRFLEGQRGRPSTYAPVCSTLGRAYRAAELDLDPLRVPIVGAPRNDRMLRSDAHAVRRELLGDDAQRPSYLWLPSFREGRWGTRSRQDVAAYHAGLPFAPDDVSRLDDWLSARGAVVVVKLHPHDVARFGGSYRALRLLTQEDMERRGLTLYQVLPAFDGLLTDMSSVWVDYLLLDKPMVFAFPDIDAYRAGRGLNLEPYEHWVPGPLTRTLDELLDALGDLLRGADPSADERSRARLRFHQYRDDRSTARLLDGLGITAR